MAEPMTSPSDLLRFGVTYSSIILLYYDYILTLPKEVKYIWGGKLRLSTLLLYIGCRYALVANVVYLFSIADEIGCDTGYKIASGLAVVGRTSIIAIWGIRTFAVYRENKFSKAVMVFFLILGTISTVFEITEVPLQKCTGKLRIPISIIVSFVTLVLYCTSTILTSLRCYQTLQQIGLSTLGQRKSLNYLILEQGLLYFGAVSVLTTISLIMNFRLPSNGFTNRLLNAFTLPLSGLLTARFILHLREWQDETSVGQIQESSTSSTIVWSEPTESRTFFSVKDFGDDPVKREALARREGLEEA